MCCSTGWSPHRFEPPARTGTTLPYSCRRDEARAGHCSRGRLLRCRRCCSSRARRARRGVEGERRRRRRSRATRRPSDDGPYACSKGGRGVRAARPCHAGGLKQRRAAETPSPGRREQLRGAGGSEEEGEVRRARAGGDGGRGGRGGGKGCARTAEYARGPSARAQPRLRARQPRRSRGTTQRARGSPPHPPHRGATTHQVVRVVREDLRRAGRAGAA